MLDSHVRVLKALGMHGIKLELSGGLTVEFELPDMKDPLCSDALSQPLKGVRVKRPNPNLKGRLIGNNIVMRWPHRLCWQMSVCSGRCGRHDLLTHMRAAGSRPANRAAVHCRAVLLNTVYMLRS